MCILERNIQFLQIRVLILNQIEPIYLSSLQQFSIIRATSYLPLQQSIRSYQMSIFTSNANRPQTNIFGNQPQTNPTNIFGGNTQQQQPTNIFGTQQPQQQQQGNIFGNQPQQQQTNIFGNQPQQQQQQQQQGNIFGNQPQQQQNNIFGNQPQQQQRTGIFNQPTTQQQGTNIFNAGQQQQGTNIFGAQQQQGTNLFPNQQQQMNINPLSQATMFGAGSDSQRVRLQIEQFLRKVDPKSLQQIRIDDMNMYKDQRLNDLPPQAKNAITTLVNNMSELRKIIDGIKKQNEELDKKAADYCKNVQQKLVKYKQCLIQNIQQSNLLQEVKNEVDLIQKQVNGFIIPLYNAHITGRQMSFDSPDEFSSTIAKNILEKMIELNNKLDEIISCQQNLEGESLSERDSATLLVLEQLLNYYENVSAKVLEFTNRYNAIKREQILSHKRTSAYEEVVKRIKEKVDSKMKQDFKCYDLIKEIEVIIEKRERFERELNEESRESFERRHDLMFSSSNRWNRI